MKMKLHTWPRAVLLALLLTLPLSHGPLTSAVADSAPAEADAEQAEEAAEEEASGDADNEAKEGDEAKDAAEAEVEAIKKEIARLTAEKDKIEAERALSTARRQQEQAEMIEQMERQKQEIEALKAEIELAETRERARIMEELTALTVEGQLAVARANVAKAEAEQATNELRLIEADFRNQITELTLAIELQQKETEAREFAQTGPVYLEDPVVDGRLVISDRRIALNGPITSRTADHIAERINYFNNRNGELPIFLVIDDSPGGSVMAGYKILKSMEGSQAPVYVVVKSFAASMAACITTLAERSFAYPNAIMLHHQLSGGLFGNLTMQQERVEELQEWWRRLAGPVADKMGVTQEEFIKLMYENASTGDWQEFADKAVELKWVDEIIEEIQETSLLEHPDRQQRQPARPTTGITIAEGGAPQVHDEPVMKVDDKGQPYTLLPRINPLDVYWIYNPDDHFRVR